MPYVTEHYIQPHKRKKIADKIAEIIKLGFDFQQKSDGNCWVNFSGHVQWIEVSFTKRKSSWEQDCSVRVNLDYDDTIRRLNKLIKIMQEINEQEFLSEYDVKRLKKAFPF